MAADIIYQFVLLKKKEVFPVKIPVLSSFCFFLFSLLSMYCQESCRHYSSIEWSGHDTLPPPCLLLLNEYCYRKFGGSCIVSNADYDY